MEKPQIHYSGSCNMKLHEAETAKKFHFELEALGFFLSLFFWEDNQL